MKKLIALGLVASATTALMAGVNLKACAGCHGGDWGKKALGKSKIVKNMTHAEVEKALLGYKTGTYGGPMKGIMKGQVARYSNADLKAASKKIGK